LKDKAQRLVDWNTDVLARFLKQVVAGRNVRRLSRWHSEQPFLNLLYPHFSNTPTVLLFVASVGCMTKRVTMSCGTSNTLSNAALRSKAPPFKWYLQLSQLNRIHALRTVSGKRDSASIIVTLEDAFVDADWYKVHECSIYGGTIDWKIALVCPLSLVMTIL
jgi:hypothetical protein